VGLILDTTEFIAAERGKLSLADALIFYPPAEPLAISVVTVSELQHGVRRAQTPQQLERRKAMLDDALAICKVMPVVTSVALRLGTIQADLAMQGTRVELADLMIGVTALEIDYSVVTKNIDHFNRIPGLHVLPSPLKL
jgi:tRNA(fMet)-specific endonuclease VapC